MKREDLLEMWGWLILLASFICAGILIGYAGHATKKYSFDAWGENGVLWGYVILGVGTVFHAVVVQLILGGIAENIRLKRIALTPLPKAPHKNCPACDEEVREAAKVCRYCRCVLVKKEVKQ